MGEWRASDPQVKMALKILSRARRGWAGLGGARRARRGWAGPGGPGGPGQGRPIITPATQEAEKGLLGLPQAFKVSLRA